MAYAQKRSTAPLPAPPLQSHILEQFPNPLDCLTAHLMLECPEVLAGVKPANLISLVNRARPCGQNIYDLWFAHHTEVAARLHNLTFMVLKTKQKALLLLCYNRDHLEQHLSHPGIRALLQKAGYDAAASCATLLEELRQRIEGSDSFPHEIGLFIGYPAKDVAAFMGMVNLPFACQGPWKIYGAPEQSLCLAHRFRSCRQRMNDILASGDPALLQLHTPEHPFFCNATDTDNHFHGQVSAFSL